MRYTVLLMIAILFIATGCNAVMPQETCNGMGLREAKEIAKTKCGPVSKTAVCNDNSKTWWIDLSDTKEGCSPACVVSTETKEAEINWRCTGLLGGSAETYTEEQKYDEGMEDGKTIAEQFVLDSSTYRYDGSELRLLEERGMDCIGCYEFIFTFTSSHAGYGDRSDKIVAQVITPHTAVVFVEQGKVTKATLDDQWDMIYDTETDSTHAARDPRCKLPAAKVEGPCGLFFGAYYDADSNKCVGQSGCSISGLIPFSTDDFEDPLETCSMLCIGM